MFDFCVIGNGVLGLTISKFLIKKNKKLNIAIIGPKNRFGSASVASGAMINVFAEMENDALSNKVLSERFKMTVNALKMWPKYHKELEKESGNTIQYDMGTYVINSSRGTHFEDMHFKYISNLKHKYHKFNIKEIDPEKINGLKTRPLDRPSKAIHLPDGKINSKELIESIEKILNKSTNVKFFDSIVEHVNYENKEVLTSKKDIVKAANIVFANGAFAQKLIDTNKELQNNTPRLFFGAGCGINLKYPIKQRGNFFKSKNASIFPKKVVRTVDRGNACGIHLVPFKNHKIYLGASSAIFTIPEDNVRANSVGYLINDSSNQISNFIGRSNIEEIKYGFRPVSEDTFPLLGESHLKGIWFINGTKRDGLTCSPYICDQLSNQMLGIKKSLLPKAFIPSRNLISYFDKEIAVKKSAIAKFNRENTHGFVLSDSSNVDDYIDKLILEIEEIYKKYNLSKFGIHPELLDLYRTNKVNKKLLIDKK